MPISKNDLKKISSLKNKTNRINLGCFVVEGVKNCKELINSDFKALDFYVTENDLINYFPNATLINYKEASRITHLKSPSSVLAVVQIPKNDLINKDCNTILYLDGIKDPGNLGTIIRSLDWFGHSQLFCSKDTVDHFNSKVIMASMGSIFRTKVHYLDFDSLQKKFPNHMIYGTYLEGENIHKTIINEKSIIVMGNESHGISAKTNNLVKNKISIPKIGKAESLNVSTATAIILNEITRN